MPSLDGQIRERGENCGKSLCIAPATTTDKETSPTIKKEIIKTFFISINMFSFKLC